MKLSIKNFKSIKRLKDFELKPFNIISGVNSSGKSSFFQLLLLLKQTIELESTKQHFHLGGYYYQAKNYQDILYNKDFDNSLEVGFLLNKEDFASLSSPTLTSLFNIYEDYKCSVKIQFLYLDHKVSIQEFSLVFEIPKEGDEKHYINCLKTDKGHAIRTNKAYFDDKILYDADKLTIKNIIYSSIFPDSYEAGELVEEENPKTGEKKIKEVVTKSFIDINDVKTWLGNFFKEISYIGPLREEPKDEYLSSLENVGVGIKGEFVAQVLENYAQEPINYYQIILSENGSIQYEIQDGTLLEGVKYWICEVLKIAKDIYAEKINDNYQIWLIGHNGIKVTIKHVGFGISQILPIVVEALRMPDGGTLILEQPEIHLHPKVQSLLYDFLYSLTLQDKMVIVETHSSHFITRMRRRIAEDESNEMDDTINLTFVDRDIFRTIGLDDYGVLSYFPEDFIEDSNMELRSIVKAQMAKRMKNE